MTAVGDVVAAVAARPGCTAADMRDALRAAGRVSITTADVVRILVANRHRVRADDSDPARWFPCGSSPAPSDAPDAGRAPELYAWQRDALEAWRRRGHRGVIEAVTGTGKTMVGVIAATEELRRGGQVLVLVPTRELLDQWAGVLCRHGPVHASVGRLGGGHRNDLGGHDVVVAVVNSARDADLRPRRPGGLLVADECHRYGSDGNRVALAAGFARRLGLSATYARTDDAHLTWLDPYFGGTCFRMGYRRAIDDGVTARFTVDLIGVELSPGERAEYAELSLTLMQTRAQLISSDVVPAEPLGAYFAAMSRLARSSSDGPLAAAARRFLRALQDRRRLLAETPAKSVVLDELAPTLAASDRAIVFTQSIAGAVDAGARLRAHGLAADAIHSGLDAPRRRDVLARFAAGELRVITAPQVLDEGVDVPAADVAVILAASRSRRQMIQRMGRVLRRKPDGHAARFAIVYAAGTVEDPAHGAHDGFLDEITPVADAVRTHAPGAPIGADR